jgi:hypothetical protein
MTGIPLRDIQINARQESFRMRHYFIGVEHLFIGMLIGGGLATRLIELHGLPLHYVIDAIRRRTGKGTSQRTFAGVPYTPRAETVLSIANDIALGAGHPEISERDLLEAIFEENDSIPVRVLAQFGIAGKSLSALNDLPTREPDTGAAPPAMQIDYGPNYEVMTPLQDAHYRLLRRLFPAAARITIERQLTGGYTSAVLLVVTPMNSDGLRDASVVVKLDRADRILDEAQRYETHVLATLPQQTARLEDKPATLEETDLAGLKYSFVVGDDGEPRDLASTLKDMPPDELGIWIQGELFPSFGKTWWMQTRPYRFQAWTEYDWLLPPLLTLERSDAHDKAVMTLRDPIRRGSVRALDFGSVVHIEGFTVHRVHRDRGAVVVANGRGSEAGRLAYKIEISGLDLSQDAHFQGEVVERLTGSIWRTRDEMMRMALVQLGPDFDLEAGSIGTLPDGSPLPNPLLAYDGLLDRTFKGTMCRIHGDLHAGNIMVGRRSTAFLIDFAQARSGHSLFDWACLEVSLLNQQLSPRAGSGWDDARALIARLSALDSAPRQQPADADLLPIAGVRGVVSGLLADRHDWSEYFISLAFTALRASLWDTLPHGARRASFMLSAYAMRQLEHRGGSTDDTLRSGQSALP